MVGFIGGATASLLRLVIEQGSHYLGTHATFTWPTFTYAFFAVLISGFLTTRFFPSTAGSGIPGVRIALAVFNGKVALKDTVAKVITSILSLTSGLSAGREGPTVAISAGFASAIGTFLHLSRKRIKGLVAVAGAGGLAAAFNTPIAGVVFTLEEIVGDLNTKMMGSMIISSVVAVITASFIQGNQPTFIVPSYMFGDPRELIIYLLIGVIAGVAGVGWVKSVLKLRSLNAKIFKNHKLTIIMISFLVVIGLSFIDYRLLGSGHEVINDTLLSHITAWKVLLLIFTLKFIATTITYASGVSGGLFMPTLLMGATLGGLVGALGMTMFSDPVGTIGAYAIIGMGAYFVAVIRTPFTAIIMVFEMTRDYKIIIPLMIANAAAYAIATRLHRGSIYESLSEQDGIHLPSREDNEVLETLLIEEAMVKNPFCLNANLTTREVFQMFKGDIKFTGFPVLKNGNLIGMVSLSELAKAHAKDHGESLIEDIATTKIISIYPDCSLLVAFDKLKRHQIGRLPVVSRLNDKRILGVITAEDIASRFGYHIKEESKSYKIEDIDNEDIQINVNHSV